MQTSLSYSPNFRVRMSPSTEPAFREGQTLIRRLEGVKTCKRGGGQCLIAIKSRRLSSHLPTHWRDLNQPPNPNILDSEIHPHIDPSFEPGCHFQSNRTSAGAPRCRQRFQSGRCRCCPRPGSACCSRGQKRRIAGGPLSVDGWKVKVLTYKVSGVATCSPFHWTLPCDKLNSAEVLKNTNG